MKTQAVAAVTLRIFRFSATTQQDNDGWLDLFVANRGLQNDFLYQKPSARMRKNERLRDFARYTLRKHTPPSMTLSIEIPPALESSLRTISDLPERVQLFLQHQASLEAWREKRRSPVISRLRETVYEAARALQDSPAPA